MYTGMHAGMVAAQPERHQAAMVNWAWRTFEPTLTRWYGC